MMGSFLREAIDTNSGPQLDDVFSGLTFDDQSSLMQKQPNLMRQSNPSIQQALTTTQNLQFDNDEDRDKLVRSLGQILKPTIGTASEAGKCEAEFRDTIQQLRGPGFQAWKHSSGTFGKPHVTEKCISISADMKRIRWSSGDATREHKEILVSSISKMVPGFSASPVFAATKAAKSISGRKDTDGFLSLVVDTNLANGTKKKENLEFKSSTDRGRFMRTMTRLNQLTKQEEIDKTLATMRGAGISIWKHHPKHGYSPACVSEKRVHLSKDSKSIFWASGSLTKATKFISLNSIQEIIPGTNAASAKVFAATRASDRPSTTYVTLEVAADELTGATKTQCLEFRSTGDRRRFIAAVDSLLY
jgi:hypothetical protein